MLDIILWVIAAALMVIGFAGTIVPMIPGLPLIFAGAWLAAFIDHYDEISVMTLVILAVLTVIGLIVDWLRPSAHKRPEQPNSVFWAPSSAHSSVSLPVCGG